MMGGSLLLGKLSVLMALPDAQDIPVAFTTLAAELAEKLKLEHVSETSSNTLSYEPTSYVQDILRPTLEHLVPRFQYQALTIDGLNGGGAASTPCFPIMQPSQEVC